MWWILLQIIILIVNISQTICKSPCSEWEPVVPGFQVRGSNGTMDHKPTAESLQKRCKYDRIEEEKITITSNRENQTYNIIIKSDATCYNPRLVIDFDTISLYKDTYYSFYIWQQNTAKDSTYFPMIEKYTNIHLLECLNSSKRILKTSSNENEWAVIDEEYQHLFESETLNDKSKEIGIIISIVSQIPSSSCIEMSNISLNAKITLNCSSVFDWDFDFEDDQTLWTFSVSLTVFCFLWALAICRIRFNELNEQYHDTLSLDINRDAISCQDFYKLCRFGIGHNENKRCHLFISYHDDKIHYPLANTWLWYVMVAVMLPLYPILLASYKTEFSYCHFLSITFFLSALTSAAFLMDLNVCTARWFCRDKCIGLRNYCKQKTFKDKCVCDEKNTNRIRRSCPCIAYIYVAVCFSLMILNLYFIAECDQDINPSNPHTFIVVFIFVLTSLLSVLWIPFLGFWLFIAIFHEVIGIHTDYGRPWSIIFAGMPTLLMILFFSNEIKFKKLNNLLLPFLGLAVSLYDVFADINLIILWCESSMIFWAVFQILFILIGQIVGAMDEYGLASNALEKPRTCDNCADGCCCLFTAIGGRIKYGFTVSDKENISNDDEHDVDINDTDALLQTLKINEMVWESIYSVALQLYIATKFNQFSGTLIFSLATSFANVTDSLYHFIENSKNQKKVENKQWITWIIWTYIVTDFLYRIIPNIILPVFIDKYYGEHYGNGDWPFYIAALFLLVLNLLLESVVLKLCVDWARLRHIVLSLVSSSYLLLGALKITGVAIIGDDGFEIVKNERVWRLGLSAIITVICFLWQLFILSNWISYEHQIFYPHIFGLIITEIIVVILHLQMASMFDNEIIIESSASGSAGDDNNHDSQMINKTNSDQTETQEVELVANAMNIISTEHSQ